MADLPSDFAAWLESALWLGKPDQARARIAEARAAGLLAGAAGEAAAPILRSPPPKLADAQGRLRRFALALQAEGERGLEVQVWRAAIEKGMDARQGNQRILDAAVAAGDWAAVIEAGGVLMSDGQPRPGWITAVETAIRSQQDMAGGSLHETAAATLRATGVRFLPLLLQRITAAELAQLVTGGQTLTPSQAALAVALLLGRDETAAARDVAAWLGATGTTDVEGRVASALCDLAEGRDEAAVAVLDSLQAEGGGFAGEGVALLAAAAAAQAGHPLLQRLAHEVAAAPGLPAQFALLSDLPARAREALPALLKALQDAAPDPLIVLDLRLGLASDLDEEEAKRAIRLVETDPSPQSEARLLTLARRLADENTVGTQIAAEFCRKHEAVLLSTAAGAAVVARVLSAVHDWQGALRGWDGVLTHQPGAAWALGRAYLSAARTGRVDLAAAYLARAHEVAGDAATGFLAFAHGACILGDLETGARFLAEFDALPADHQARATDRYNLAERLRAVITGSTTRLARTEQMRRSQPEGAPPARVLLVDPGFNLNAGHHFSYSLFATRFFAEEMRLDQAEVWVCGPMLDEDEAPAPSLLGSSLHRLFGFNPHVFDEFPKSAAILGNIARAWEAELDRAFAGVDLASVEVVYFHSMKVTLVEGLARWIAARFGGRPIVLILGIIEVDYLNLDDATIDNCHAAYATAHRILQETPGVEFLFYAETKLAVQELTDVMGDRPPVQLIPYLAAALAGPPEDAPVAFSRERVTIGLIGSSRRDRGLDLFPELMLALANQPEVRWIVQMSRSLAEQIDPVFPDYLMWAAKQGICRWIDDRLDTEAYYAALREMDIVLMPYRDRYAVSGSGVFYEAIALERFVIAPRLTFMAEVLEDWSYPSEIMASATLPAALRSVQNVLRQKQVLEARMRDLRQAGGDRLPVGRFRELLRAMLVKVREAAPA